MTVWTDTTQILLASRGFKFKTLLDHKFNNGFNNFFLTKLKIYLSIQIDRAHKMQPHIQRH